MPIEAAKTKILKNLDGRVYPIALETAIMHVDCHQTAHRAVTQLIQEGKVRKSFDRGLPFLAQTISYMLSSNA